MACVSDGRISAIAQAITNTNNETETVSKDAYSLSSSLLLERAFRNQYVCLSVSNTPNDSHTAHPTKQTPYEWDHVGSTRYHRPQRSKGSGPDI